MLGEEGCSFFRPLKNVSLDLGLGHCDLVAGPTLCGGRVPYCEKADVLIRYLYEEWKEKSRKTEEIHRRRLNPPRSII